MQTAHINKSPVVEGVSKCHWTEMCGRQTEFIVYSANICISFNSVVIPPAIVNKQKTNSLFADVAAAGLGHAQPPHKEPIDSSGLCPGPP